MCMVLRTANYFTFSFACFVSENFISFVIYYGNKLMSHINIVIDTVIARGSYFITCTRNTTCIYSACKCYRF